MNTKVEYLHLTDSDHVAVAVAEPVAWMWQHDETGRVGFVDVWQVECGKWEAGNPRLKLIAPLYRAPQHPAIDIDKAKKTSIEVFSDSCSHTHEAIEYMAELLKAEQR